jgi:hypothetical protein
MYNVTYYAANGRETSACVHSWTRAMDKAAQLATRQAKPPFPIVIKDELGRIIHEIKG